MTSWLPTPGAAPPEERHDPAAELARVAVKRTQRDAGMRGRVPPQHAEDPDALIAVSRLVATDFATVAAANDHWRDPT